ncbi:MAG: glycerol-3-phosphate 1-O-acyltransferase PlsY [Candidatus Saccharibacteria bacterium]
MKGLLLIIFCYLLGSIPFSYLVPKLFSNLDIRKYGSGNVGATNVLRTIGWPAALMAVTGDVLKGVIAAWLAVYLGGGIYILLCPLVAVLGHCYTVFLDFKGGKGVATSAGVLAVLAPKLLLVLFLVFVLVIVLTRFVSLGSILAATAAPFLTVYLYPTELYLVFLIIILAFMIIYKHKANIDRLRKGTEPKIGEGK